VPFLCEKYSTHGVTRGCPTSRGFRGVGAGSSTSLKTFYQRFPGPNPPCLIECPVARLKPFTSVSVAPSGLIPVTSLPTAGAVGCILAPLRGWLRAS